MADEYDNFEQLSYSERENIDYRIHLTNTESPITIIAPHGGGIEPGTSEIARSISSGGFNYYSFDGIKTNENKKFLHITSTNFDEPQCLALCKQSHTIVTIHGNKEKNEEIIWVGGLNDELKHKIVKELNKANFNTKEDDTNHSGKNPANICNKGSSQKGVQIEISKKLRIKMFVGWNREGRNHTTDTFNIFTSIIQNILMNFESNKIK